ncbi:Tyrosine-protein phosphatase non-receptor type substrate 1, partial [Leptosomus discolor]
RVTRAASGSDTDFTIHIRDAQPEDAGTYYCVKFRRLLVGGDEVFRHGGGTEVSLHETSLVPSVVAAAVVLCLLLLGLFLALYLYRRKRRGEAHVPRSPAEIWEGNRGVLCWVGWGGHPASFSSNGSSFPRSSEVLDAETSHLPSKVRASCGKEDHDIHYADLQTAAPWRGRSSGAAPSEYASVRVAAK